jgi:NADH-quinone oxidoreductase subunit M
VRLLADLILLIGATFTLLGALGLVRMPDVYNRIQAGTKAVTLGALSLLLGIGLLYPQWWSKLSWRFDALSWFFALITTGSALFTSWFSCGAWERDYAKRGGNLWLYHTAIALNVFTMLILLASGDLLSLFIGWELVGWAGFLLMALAGGIATKAAIRYITYAMAGGMAIFGGIALVYSASGSLQLEAVITAVEQISTTKLWLMVILFGGGFGVKMGLLPFHLWKAPAYAETPGPASAFLGAISSRMGLFAILLVLVKLFGIVNIDSLKAPFTLIDARDLLAWIAVFTIIFPTYTAMKQTDAGTDA